MGGECEDLGNSICFVTSHDQCRLSTILEAIQKLECVQGFSSDKDIVYLGRQDHCDDAMHVKTRPSQLLVELYRRQKLAGSGCKTILSAESQLVVVQLCLAEYSRQKYGIYDTDASEVLNMSRALTERKLSRHANPSPEESTEMSDSSENVSPLDSVSKLYEAFLSSCNIVDVADVCRQVQLLFERDEDAFKSFRAKQMLIVLQLPDEPLERKALEILCGRTTITEIKVEMLPASSPGDISAKGFKLHAQEINWDVAQGVNDNRRRASFLPKTPRFPVSSTEVLVHQVFLSFLGVVVNSRDEISLARCLSYSPSGLDHRGFTALKNVAKTKNMSMYQTAVSYITRLRLRGTSYAPSAENSPLSDHVKGLGEFVTNVQKLQTLVEEVPDTRESITKVLLSITGILCKCRDSVFKQAAVEKVCGKLTSEFEALLTSLDRRNEASPPKAVNQGGSILGLKTLKLILTFLDEEATRPASRNATSVLSDCTLTQTTPVRMPSLLAQFRSPEIVDPASPENRSLRDRVIVATEEVKQPKIFGYKSDMAWAEPPHRNPLQERNSNVDHNAPSQPDNQPFKLWAETPPEKHRQARIFTHEFASLNPSPSCEQKSGTHLLREVIDHTPKRPTGRGGKMTDAALDKENLVANHGPAGEGGKIKGADVKRRVKRVLMEDAGGSQPSKKAKKVKKSGAGGQKKKRVVLVKGQKTLNQFFRL